MAQKVFRTNQRVRFKEQYLRDGAGAPGSFRIEKIDKVTLPITLACVGHPQLVRLDGYRDGAQISGALLEEAS